MIKTRLKTSYPASLASHSVFFFIPLFMSPNAVRIYLNESVMLLINFKFEWTHTQLLCGDAMKMVLLDGIFWGNGDEI